LSLRKSPTWTPAFLEAARRNALHSTGPCTRRGKAQSCLNRLKTGERCEKIPEGTKPSHAKAQRKQSTLLGEPLRLGVFARDCLFFTPSSVGEGRMKRC
jgi:hypothetical protein